VHPDVRDGGWSLVHDGCCVVRVAQGAYDGEVRAGLYSTGVTEGGEEEGVRSDVVALRNSMDGYVTKVDGVRGTPDDEVREEEARAMYAETRPYSQRILRNCMMSVCPCVHHGYGRGNVRKVRLALSALYDARFLAEEYCTDKYSEHLSIWATLLLESRSRIDQVSALARAPNHSQAPVR
jgi:hypothetical protein